MVSNRCKLDKLHEADYEDVKKLYTSAKVREYLGEPIDEAYTQVKFNQTIECSKSDSLCWVVRLKSNNEFIGLVSLDNHIDGSCEEVSYEFLPDSDMQPRLLANSSLILYIH